MFGGIALCSVLPERRRTLAHAVAVAVTLGAAALVLSLAGAVFAGGQVERSLGDLVPGTGLTLRAESSGAAIVLLSLVATLVALAEGGRRPMERAALLLCLGGTMVAALGGNAILLFGGLELGNVGAVLLTAAGRDRLRLRDQLGFALQHVAALGLLVAALRLQNQYQTTDLTALPAGALGAVVGLGWAAAGALRLLAAPGLSGDSGGSSWGTSWTAVAAAPAGLLVLLRLLQVTGDDLPAGIGVVLVLAGIAVTAAGALEAIRVRSLTAAAGRALCTALTGPVLIAAGTASAPATAAFAAAGLALCLALGAAPAWGGGGRPPGGSRARPVRALAIAVAGGLPIGYGATAIILVLSALAARGEIAAPALAASGAAVLLLMVAGGLAVAEALRAPAGTETSTRLRLDALIPLVASLVAVVLPGVVQSTFIHAVVAGTAGGWVALDAAAVRGPGGGWSGGYLAIAGVLGLVTLLSALVVGGGELSPTALRERSSSAVPWASLTRWRDRIAGWRAGSPPRPWLFVQRGVADVDTWLVAQPGMAAVLVGAVVLFFVFR